MSRCSIEHNRSHPPHLSKDKNELKKCDQYVVSIIYRDIEKGDGGGIGGELGRAKREEGGRQKGEGG